MRGTATSGLWRIDNAASRACESAVKLTPQDVEDMFPRLLREWMKRLGLDDWELRILAGPMDNEYATSGAFFEYGEVTFRFDPASIVDRVEHHDNPTEWLNRLARHEVLHCITSPLATAADALAKPQGEAVSELVDILHECTVRQLESVLDAVGVT